MVHHILVVPPGEHGVCHWRHLVGKHKLNLAVSTHNSAALYLIGHYIMYFTKLCTNTNLYH